MKYGTTKNIISIYVLLETYVISLKFFRYEAAMGGFDTSDKDIRKTMKTRVRMTKFDVYLFKIIMTQEGGSNIH